MYAKTFLEKLKKYSEENQKAYFQNLKYILSDISEDMLDSAKSTLKGYEDHIETQSDKYKGKILFARHGNLWDQLPFRMLKIKEDKFYEVLVQANISKDVEKEILNIYPDLDIKSLYEDIRKKNLVSFIFSYPKMWKILYDGIKLETKDILIEDINKYDIPYRELLINHCKEISHDGLIIYNYGVLDNIGELSELIDWKNGGYIEIVDIIFPTLNKFPSSDILKKFDGSLAVFVNGPLIESFNKEKDRAVVFEKIRKLNYIADIRSYSLKDLLLSNKFITFAEVATRKDQTKEQIYKLGSNITSLGVDVLGFSDQAGLNSDLLTISETINQGILKDFPGGRVLPIMKTRNRSKEEIENLVKSLEQSNVENIFLVTGDQEKTDSSKHYLKSVDLTPEISKKLLTGGVAHLTQEKIEYTLKKVDSGVDFLILNASYDKVEWKKMFELIRRYKLNEKIPLIASIIPIISHELLNVVKNLGGISISQDVLEEFEKLDKDRIKERGIELAIQMVNMYRETNLFHGIYIYTKSLELINEVVNLIEA